MVASHTVSHKTSVGCPDDIDSFPIDREVARAQGYMAPRQFQAMFRYVAERAYEKGSLLDFLKANS